jgi:hypothetical protein
LFPLKIGSILKNWIFLTFIFLFTAVGCIPGTTAPVARQSTDGNISDSPFGDDSEQSTVAEKAYWFDGGIKKQTLTLDISNLKTSFIFGDDVSVLLSQNNNSSRSYCVYVDFQAGFGTTPKQLRMKAIPAQTYDPVAGKINRYFRILSNIESGNEICNVSTVNSYSSAGVPNFTAPVLADISNTVNNVCLNCLNIISSTSVKLYEQRDGANHIVKNETVAMDTLNFKIDVNSNTDNETPNCSTLNCQNQGFDCCVNGQCVKDAGPKYSRSELATQFPQSNDGDATSDALQEFDLAELLKGNDPNWYRDYPQYYFICLENIPGDGGSGDGGNDDGTQIDEAQARLNKNIQDAYCIEELRTNTDIDPFHTDPISPTGTYKVCSLSQTPGQNPSTYFRDVMTRMYENCGCSETTYSNMVANCPRYTYRVISTDPNLVFSLSDVQNYMTTNGLTDLNDIADLGDLTKINAVECIAPEVDPNDLPFQDLDVLVSSKAVAHRYFDVNTDSNGDDIEITDVSELPVGASGTQEGDEFRYLDNEKLFPDNKLFNMNSLLGQMNVNLSGSVPAKIIDIEFDKQYYIATIDGYYTPCPSCAKDSWFPNFSPNPNTNYGVGLTSIGHTTSRDSWGSNSTFGNYEDTIFGRACWLPPTMLPFSHSASGSPKTQRLNRLKTQAAMYVNGYQRDWFGFNKGALIGSFDGVSWFAIGKGRIAKSTSNKLFIAINAPFGDLASPNNHLVTVQEWDFITTGAHYDYNIDLSINHPKQNEAGQCQRSHRCETDSDCITQLGWEYACADVNSIKTSWPKFSVDGAKEIENDFKTGTILSILNQEVLPPGTSSRKCVYRGAGSPCRTDYESITDENLRKTLTCAPNFYCADLDNSAVFNIEVARYGQPLENLAVPANHLFGQEANILGRPKQYLANGVTPLASFPSDIKSTITNNLEVTNPGIGSNAGICRPGKKLPKRSIGAINDTQDFLPSQQHISADPEYRTDYISQIGGCNTALFNSMKTSSCPVIGTDGNYEYTKDTFISLSNLDKASELNKYANAQNSCGLESISAAATINASTRAEDLRDDSAFKLIEGRSLDHSSINFEPTLARDACFRRAGSVCNTDLDCSPNYKHAELVDIINPEFFGNEAEKKYWTESLVCGQGADEPTNVNDPTFNTYNIRRNRCCREVGSDITIYTEKTPDLEPTDPLYSLNSRKLASTFPNDPDRYSRFSILDNEIDPLTGESDFDAPNASTEKDVNDVLTDATNILLEGQWKTINETAKKTCCGGGWVRKFADGTNNWQINRLNIDVNDFKCLNFRSPLVSTDKPENFGLTQSQNSQDSQNTCLDPGLTAAGCSQYNIPSLTASIQKPKPNNELDRMKLFSDSSNMDTGVNSWQSNPWSFSPLVSADANILTYLDWGSNDIDTATRKNISVTLPSFITWPNAGIASLSDLATDVKIVMETRASTGSNNFDGTYNSTESSQEFCAEITPPSYSCGDPNGWFGLCEASAPTNVSSFGAACLATGKDCCYAYDPSSRVLKIAYEYNDIVDNEDRYNKADKDFYMLFDSPGTARWEEKVVSSSTPSSNYTDSPIGGAQGSVLDHRRSSTPGNATYYMSRLSKLELIGIPQITYEPLYCNDNYQKLVPGIFKESVDGQSLTNVNDFNAHSKTFKTDPTKSPWQSETDPNINSSHLDYSGINEAYATTSELLDHEPIFSSNEFMCCKPLGTQIDLNYEDGTACCSGFAAAGQNSSSGGLGRCMLAPGTNLNVYLNKFVSGEGMSEEIDNPLTEYDFDEQTGSPKFEISVINKVQAIAQEYCTSGTYTQGAAYGPFVAQPVSSQGQQSGASPLFSIVDSISDGGANNQDPAGFAPFASGYRWNNNIYCLD